jgi:hypothetical protein
VRTILTYSQSPSPESRWFADQTRMYAQKRWVRMPYCPGQLAKARVLEWRDYGGGVVQALDRVRARRARGGRVIVRFRLLRPAHVRVAGRKAQRFAQGTHRVRLRGPVRRVRVVARTGGARYVRTTPVRRT